MTRTGNLNKTKIFGLFMVSTLLVSQCCAIGLPFHLMEDDNPDPTIHEHDPTNDHNHIDDDHIHVAVDDEYWCCVVVGYDNQLIICLCCSCC